MAEIPRWALERAEEEMARYLGAKPNPQNVNVWLKNPEGWTPYLVLASYIAGTEKRYVESENVVELRAAMSKAINSGRKPVSWRLTEALEFRLIGAQTRQGHHAMNFDHPRSLFGLPYVVGQVASGKEFQLIAE